MLVDERSTLEAYLQGDGNFPVFIDQDTKIGMSLYGRNLAISAR